MKTNIRTMNTRIIENFSGGSGYIEITNKEVQLNVGDHYIGDGLSGKNIFRWENSQYEKYPNPHAIGLVL